METYNPDMEEWSFLWSSLFEILSLRSAHRFLADMGFELPVSPSIQSIANQFVCNYLKPGQNRLILWQTTIQQIEQEEGMPYVEAIIDWAESMDEKYQMEGWYTSLEIWNSLLLNIIARPKYAQLLETLESTDEERSQLQMISVEYREKIMEFRKRLELAEDEITAEAQIAWQGCYDYLRYTTDDGFPFISLQSKFVIYMQMWKELRAKFSQDTLERLREWGEAFAIEIDLIRADSQLQLIDPQILDS